MTNQLSEQTSSHKKLAELTPNEIKQIHGYLKVETQGVIYSIRFDPRRRVYAARNSAGDLFESTRLADLKRQLNNDATPFPTRTVALDGTVVGQIMNQHDWFFFRPAKSDGSLDTEKLCDQDDVLAMLNSRGDGLYTKSEL